MRGVDCKQRTLEKINSAETGDSTDGPGRQVGIGEEPGVNGLLDGLPMVTREATDKTGAGETAL